MCVSQLLDKLACLADVSSTYVVLAEAHELHVIYMQRSRASAVYAQVTLQLSQLLLTHYRISISAGFAKFCTWQLVLERLNVQRQRAQSSMTATKRNTVYNRVANILVIDMQAHQHT